MIFDVTRTTGWTGSEPNKRLHKDPDFVGACELRR
jgi:hypothetical protein